MWEVVVATLDGGLEAVVEVKVAVVVATPDGGELGAEGRVLARRLEDGGWAIQ